MRWLLCFIGLSLPSTLLAEAPVTEQESLAKSLGKKVQRFEMWTDDGNVTGLIFINHQALTKSVGEKPGITDANLRELTRFPRLTAVNFEAQPIGDAGLRVLRQFPNLKQVGFHYMGKAKGAHASPDFITAIDGMRDLEIIEIKHNFRMEAINLEKLKGPFANVWRLVLDTPITAEQTMHMIRLCPNVTDLQLHRTDLSSEQLTEVGDLLPKLEVFWLKPRHGATAVQFSSLRSYPRLRIFSPQSIKQGIAFEGGWDALAKLPHLERLEIAAAARVKNAAALEQLQQQCPKLRIDSRLTRSRNYQGL